MKSAIAILVFLLTTTSTLANEQDRDAIKTIIQTFEQSIESKDKEKFLSLFVTPNIPMYGVVSELGMVKRRKAVEEINRRDNKNFTVTKFWTSSPQKMIDRITNSKSMDKEVFSELTIHTDNDIAVVYADYEYFKNDTKVHWGSESWHLIKTLHGWKIGAVNYSITFVN